MTNRILRRRFLQLSGGAVVAAAAYSALGAPGLRTLGPASAARRVLSREFHLGPGELAEGQRSGLTAASSGLRLASGRSAGHLLSPVFESDLKFHHVGLFWSGDFPQGSSTRFWVRTSADGEQWGAWQEAQVEMPPGPRAQYDNYGSLVWADGARHAQFMAELQGSGRKPAIRKVGLEVINPYDGPPAESASAAGGDGTALAAETDVFEDEGAALEPAMASGKPITFKREDWGADESLRFSGGQEIWPRSFVPTKKMVVHHTVTGNNYWTVSDAKAHVRAIYAYHTRTLGWGDIGYHCLVDKFGNSYEGRRGRNGPGYDGPGGREILSEDVVAGHASAYNYGAMGVALLGTFCSYSECAGGASPTSAMLGRLKDVLAWACRKHGIRPGGRSDFLKSDGTWHRDLRNISGHRDVALTSCPGGNTYALLPAIRRDVASRLSPPGPAVSITSAPKQGTVKRGDVKYAWAGSGGSGGYRYSYCLEGWSERSTGEVNHVRGFAASKRLIWSSWSKEKSARLCYVMPGVYTLHLKVKDSNGRVGVYQATRTFKGTKQDKPCNGALIKGSSATVYVVKGGLKRQVPNSATFAAEGMDSTNVNNVTDSVLSSLPTGDSLPSVLDDGNLLEGSGSPAYVMDSRRKRPISSDSVFEACGYGRDAIYVLPSSVLRSISDGSPLSGPPCPHLSPPHGYLVTGSGPKVWVMRKGLRRHIPNMLTFAAEGFRWGNLNRLADSSMKSIPKGDALLDVLADGNLLKGSGSAVYVTHGGKKRHIASPDAFTACNYGWDAVIEVSDSGLDAIPTGAKLTGPPCPHLLPPGGYLVTGSGPKIWVMQGGLKRHVPNLLTFSGEGFQWGNLNRIADSQMDSIPTGDPLLDMMADGNLLKGSGSAVYVMQGGEKRHVAGLDVFSTCGYGWDAVIDVSDSALEAIATGAKLTGPPCPHLSPPDGYLVTGSGSSVYVMDGGKKRHIISLDAFSACGYRWGNVNRIADSHLAAIVEGPDVNGSNCP